VPVPRVLPDPSVMVNTDPGSQVPLMIGVVSFVMRAGVGLAIDGASGAVESITIGRELGRDAFPIGSVAVAVRLLAHSGNGDARVRLQLPDPSTVATPRVFSDPSSISTVDPGSAVPAMVGVVSLVRYGLVVSPATFEITGAIGERESTANTVAVEVLVFPARSVRVTE
jgi:hypothetical protein